MLTPPPPPPHPDHHPDPENLIEHLICPLYGLLLQAFNWYLFPPREYRLLILATRKCYYLRLKVLLTVFFLCCVKYHRVVDWDFFIKMSSLFCTDILRTTFQVFNALLTLFTQVEILLGKGTARTPVWKRRSKFIIFPHGNVCILKVSRTRMFSGIRLYNKSDRLKYYLSVLIVGCL